MVNVTPYMAYIRIRHGTYINLANFWSFRHVKITEKNLKILGLMSNMTPAGQRPGEASPRTGLQHDQLLEKAKHFMLLPEKLRQIHIYTYIYIYTYIHIYIYTYIPRSSQELIHLGTQLKDMDLAPLGCSWHRGDSTDGKGFSRAPSCCRSRSFGAHRHWSVKSETILLKRWTSKLCLLVAVISGYLVTPLMLRGSLLPSLRETGALHAGRRKHQCNSIYSIQRSWYHLQPLVSI